MQHDDAATDNFAPSELDQTCAANSSDNSSIYVTMCAANASGAHQWCAHPGPGFGDTGRSCSTTLDHCECGL